MSNDNWNSGERTGITLHIPPTTKATQIINLLARPSGATLAELATATSWQQHSVRAYLTRLRRAGFLFDRVGREAGPLAYHFYASTSYPDEPGEPSEGEASEAVDA